jgi:hypothetical protein
VGAVVGFAVGAAVGAVVGLAVGAAVGAAVGFAVGAAGLALGDALGLALGDALGLALGDALGLALGTALPSTHAARIKAAAKISKTRITFLLFISISSIHHNTGIAKLFDHFVDSFFCKFYIHIFIIFQELRGDFFFTFSVKKPLKYITPRFIQTDHTVKSFRTA